MIRMRKSKYNTKSFSDEVERITDGEYTVLGEYTKSFNKVLMRHNTCGHEWNIRPSNFLNCGNRCPMCGSNKISAGDFEERVRGLVGDEYSIAGEFTGYNNKVKMRHNTCGHEWDVLASFFAGPRQTRCPNCNRGPVSRDEAEKRVYLKHKDEIQIIEYVNSSSPVTFRRSKCNHEETVSCLDQIINRKTADCPICRVASNKQATAIKLEHKRKLIEANLHDVCEIEWIVKSEAVLTCKKCGAKQYRKGLAEKSVFTCDCSSPKRRTKKTIFCKMTAKETAEWIVTKSNNELLVKDFVDGKSKNIQCKIRCDRCGHEFTSSLIRAAYALERGTDICPECGGWNNKRKTNKQVQKELDDTYGENEYVLLSDYRDYDTSIKVRHSCGNEYDITPGSLLDKSRSKKTKMCPACYSQQKSSYGEKLIGEWLRENGINYKSQYPIIDPERKKYKLFYDFAILDEDDIPVAIIEYDGKQHFKPVKHFGGIDNYKKTKRNDGVKNQYCRDNEIAFMRIPYTDSDETTVKKLKAFIKLILLLCNLKENVS